MGIRHGHIPAIANKIVEQHISNDSKHISMNNIGVHSTVKQIVCAHMSGQTHSAAIDDRHAVIMHSITNMHAGMPKKNIHETIT